MKGVSDMATHRRAWALFSHEKDGWVTPQGEYSSLIRDALVVSGQTAFTTAVAHPGRIEAIAVWTEEYVQ